MTISMVLTSPRTPLDDTARFRYDPYTAEAQEMLPNAVRETALVEQRGAAGMGRLAMCVLDAAFTDTCCVGDHVVISTDRGYDVGVVKSVSSHGAQGMHVAGRVQRRATAAEVESWNGEHAEMEIDACASVDDVFKSLSLALTVTVLYVAVQFDRRKAVVYYSSPLPLDPRVAIAPLYKLLRMRVVLEWVHPVSVQQPTQPLQFSSPLYSTRSFHSSSSSDLL